MYIWVALKEQQKLISRRVTTTEVTDEKESKNAFFCRSQRGVTTWKDMQNMSLKGGVNQWEGARQCCGWQKRPCMDDHKPSPEVFDSTGETHLFVHRMYQHACTWPTLIDRIYYARSTCTHAQSQRGTQLVTRGWED